MMIRIHLNHGTITSSTNHVLLRETMFGHCIHVTPADMDILAHTIPALLTTESNMVMLGAPVLILSVNTYGNDAYTHDMLESLKVFTHATMLVCQNVGWLKATVFAMMAEKYFTKV